MDVRKCECAWCERTYAVKDSTASDLFSRKEFCSEECEAEHYKALSECDKWMDEIGHAWNKLTEEYEPGEDEDYPHRENGTPCTRYPDNKRMYLAFKTRYQKWKNNHCWKKSFWAWDEDSGGSFFGGGGGGDGSGAEGCVKVVLKLIGILLAVWIGWAVIKGLWNGIFSGGGSEVITEAAIMEKWQEHLEKRRDAFDDGLPEKEIEAKGFRNYTWDEWQAKFQKEHETQEKKEGPAKTRAQEIGEQALSTAKGLGDKAKSLWQNITSDEVKDPEAELKRLNARLAELEGESNTNGQQGAVASNAKAPKSAASSQKSSKYRVAVRGDEAVVTVTSVDQSRQGAWEAAYRTAVKGAISGFVGDLNLQAGNKDRFEERLNTISKTDVKRFRTFKDLQEGKAFTVGIEATFDKKELAPKFAEVFPEVFAISTVAAPVRPSASRKPVVSPAAAELEAKARAEAAARAKAEAEAKRLAEEMARRKDAEAKVRAEAAARAKAEAEAKRLTEEMARKDAEAKARAEAEARAKVEAEAKRLAKEKARKDAEAEVAAEGTVSGQQNGTGRKASKDSKAIRIVVRGKGRTKEAAVRWALREAVWRTVGTWVDSKTRILNNHDKVVAQVKTITEADVPKFEVLDVQEQNGGFVVKVRVSVLKKKIAPKFATVFPDVFTLD